MKRQKKNKNKNGERRWTSQEKVMVETLKFSNFKHSKVS